MCFNIFNANSKISIRSLYQGEYCMCALPGVILHYSYRHLIHTWSVADPHTKLSGAPHSNQTQLLAHLVINQRAYTIMLCQSLLVSLSVLVSVLLSVYSPPSHIVRHRNFIFGVNMYICPQYVYIKYLMILTYCFQMAAILILFI